MIITNNYRYTIVMKAETNERDTMYHTATFSLARSTSKSCRTDLSFTESKKKKTIKGLC